MAVGKNIVWKKGKVEAMSSSLNIKAVAKKYQEGKGIEILWKKSRFKRMGWGRI